MSLLTLLKSYVCRWPLHALGDCYTQGLECSLGGLPAGSGAAGSGRRRSERPPTLGSAARGAWPQTLPQTFPVLHQKIVAQFANSTAAVVSGLQRKKSGSHLPNKLENPSVEQHLVRPRGHTGHLSSPPYINYTEQQLLVKCKKD